MHQYWGPLIFLILAMACLRLSFALDDRRWRRQSTTMLTTSTRHRFDVGDVLVINGKGLHEVAEVLSSTQVTIRPLGFHPVFWLGFRVTQLRLWCARQWRKLCRH